MKRLTLALLLSAAPVIALAQNVLQNNGFSKSLTNVAQTIKSTRSNLSWIACDDSNNNTEVDYLQFFDTTGTVTVGVTAPKFSLPVQGGQVNIQSDINASFLNAVQVAATTTPTGGTAPGSNLQCTFGVQ